MSYQFKFCLLVTSAAASWSPSAHAIGDATKAAARELARGAKRDFDLGHYDQASHSFQKAFHATEVPTLALWSARALVKQGRLVAASEFYRRAAQLKRNELWIGDTQEQAQQLAAQELEQLLPRIPSMVLTVQGAKAADIEISIDGVVVPNSLLGVTVPTDPGLRQVTAKRGTEVVQESLELKEGERRELVLKFEPSSEGAAAPMHAAMTANAASRTPPAQKAQVAGVAANRRSSPLEFADSAGNGQRTAAWVSFGVGGVGLTVGAIAGLVVKSRYSEFEPSCQDDHCDSNQIDQGSLDSYNYWRTVSVVGLIAGAVGAGAGVTLLLTHPKSANSSRVGVWLSPTAAGLRGGF